jgi:phosphatidylserine/phosphatidylglycerophosphate/cardiolipin synthase-like enzyme
VISAWLYATRIPAIWKNEIALDPQQSKEEFNAQIPANVRWKADNYNHLMEQPTLFYAAVLTLALLNAGSAPGGVLHAKAVIADDEAVFVTSANLTEAALDRNIELGVLIRDRALALTIGGYFRSLIDRDLLKPLPLA